MKFTRLLFDDWECYYDAAGELVAEGHSVSASEILQAAGVEVVDLQPSPKQQQDAELGLTPRTLS